MTTSTELEHILNFIFIYATRDSLEKRTGWYYRCIGKPGGEEKANRMTLERIWFIQEVWDIAPDGIYQLSINFEVYKQPFMSGAEVIKFIMQKCDFEISKEWNGFKTKDGFPVELRHVALDKEFKMR